MGLTGASALGPEGFILAQNPGRGGRGVCPLLFFVGQLQRGLQAAGIELGWPGSISAHWTDAPGVGSTGAPAAGDGRAAPPPTAPRLPRHSPGNRGGGVVLGSGSGWGRRQSLVLSCCPRGGGRGSQGPHPAPQPTLSPPQLLPTGRGCPACIASLSLSFAFLPLFVCLLPGSEGLPPPVSVVSISTSASPSLSLPVSL